MDQEKIMDITENTEIIVCSKCLTASCWLGIFKCNEYLNASAIKMPVKELKKLDKEHPYWWKKELKGRK